MLLPFPGGPETMLLLLLALLLEGLLGHSTWLERLLPRPATLIAAAARWSDRRLNRIDRSDSTRQLRGSLLLAMFLLLAVITGLAVTLFARYAPAAYGWVLELVVVMRCLTARQPWLGLRDVLTAMDSKGPEPARLQAGRIAVATMTDRQLWALDQHGLIRAALEGAARALARQIVAPVLSYLAFGLPGLLVWTVAETMERCIGLPEPRYQAFGRRAAQLGALLGWLPAWLTALLLLLAALFVPGATPGGVWPALSTAQGHPSGTAALPVAALAGALGLALGGPRREGDRTLQEAWLGKGRARAVPRDLRRAMVLHHVSLLLVAVPVGLAAWLVLRFA
jgi:adenosylcobinamide-phosphate synthase